MGQVVQDDSDGGKHALLTRNFTQENRCLDALLGRDDLLRDPRQANLVLETKVVGVVVVSVRRANCVDQVEGAIRVKRVSEGCVVLARPARVVARQIREKITVNNAINAAVPPTPANKSARLNIVDPDAGLSAVNLWVEYSHSALGSALRSDVDVRSRFRS